MAMKSKMTKVIVFSIVFVTNLMVGCSDKSQSEKSKNIEKSAEPYVSDSDLEKESHSISREWFRENITGKFSGNCERIFSNPSEDVRSHYNAPQRLVYITKSKVGNQFNLAYKVGADYDRGEDYYYRYSTSNEWCERDLAHRIKEQQ